MRKESIGLLLGTGISLGLVVGGIYYQKQNLVNGGAGIATILMVLFVAYQVKLTRESLEETKRERKFSLMREHTRNLKKKIVRPWLEELTEKIGEAKNTYPPQPDYYIHIPEGGRLVRHHLRYYEGEDLEVEKNEPILFKDLINYHSYIYEGEQKEKLKLKEYHQELKEYAKELARNSKEIENKVTKFLTNESEKGNIRILSWKEYEKSRIKVPHFESESLKRLLLAALLVDKDIQKDTQLVILENRIVQSKSHGTSKIEVPFEVRVDERIVEVGKYVIPGETITPEDIEKVKSEIQRTVTSLLEKARRESKEDIKKIHELIEKFNNCKEELIKELKKLEGREIFDEECEFTRFQ